MRHCETQLARALLYSRSRGVQTDRLNNWKSGLALLSHHRCSPNPVTLFNYSADAMYGSANRRCRVQPAVDSTAANHGAL